MLSDQTIILEVYTGYLTGVYGRFVLSAVDCSIVIFLSRDSALKRLKIILTTHARNIRAPALGQYDMPRQLFHQR